MNERIRKLAEQAGLEPFYVKSSPWQVEFEKFTQLVVQECINIVSQELCNKLAGVGSTNND